MPSDGTDFQSLPNALVALLATPLTTSATGVQTLERQVGGRGSLLPTPTTRDRKGANQRGDDTCLTGALLPTPSVADGTGGHERRGGERGEELLLKGVARAVAEGALMPTPRATDGTNGGPNQRGSSGDLMLPSAVNLLPTPTTEPLTGNGHARHLGADVKPARWGEYESAIRRWEAVTRPAPEPTKLNSKGNPKLSDEFDEWLMGYPAGWITDVPSVTWNEALKMCGNGVVPQQGAAGVRALIVMGRWVA